MDQLTTKQIIALLVRVSNCSIQDFYYFPEIIIFCKQKMQREEFNFLLREGYISEYKFDSFGRFYKLSKKAEDFIYSTIISIKHQNSKKRIKIASNQGRFNFA